MGGSAPRRSNKINSAKLDATMLLKVWKEKFRSNVTGKSHSRDLFKRRQGSGRPKKTR